MLTTHLDGIFPGWSTDQVLTVSKGRGVGGCSCSAEGQVKLSKNILVFHLASNGMETRSQTPGAIMYMIFLCPKDSHVASQLPDYDLVAE